MSTRIFAVLGLTLAAATVESVSAGATTIPNRKDIWIEVSTEHFTLYSDASESRTKEIGLDLEKLRSVLLLFKQSLTANSPVPTSIFIFKSDSAFEPYKPLYQGKPRSGSGYFQETADGNYITIASAWNTDPRPPVYHEYLHYFLHNNFPPQPLWYDEGLAEFYSTFQASETDARVGRPVESHVYLLRGEQMLPLERLFAVRQDSPEYNEQSRQGLFYAESWALVHYLMRGEPKRTVQMGRFLVLLQQGKPQDEAFREAFQTDYAGLLKELTSYVRGYRFPYTKTTFSELQVPTETKIRPMSYEDTVFHLGDLLAHGSADRAGDAEAYFQAVLAANGCHAAALAGLGLLRMRQDKHEEAAEFFRRAVASGAGDFRAYFYHGELLMRVLSSQPLQVGNLDENQRQTVEQARDAFRKSVALNGTFAEARGSLGRTYLLEDDSRLDEGIRELEAAVKMLPSRKDLAMDLATLYDRKKETAKSEEVLQRALGPDASAVLANRKKTSDFEQSVERVNKLLQEKKEDEAVALLEELVSKASDGVRDALDEQLKAVRRGAARNRSARQYNEAISRWSKHDLEGALAGFQKVAATAEDPTLAKVARENAEQISRLLSGKPRKRTPPTKEP